MFYTLIKRGFLTIQSARRVLSIFWSVSLMYKVTSPIKISHKLLSVVKKFSTT